MAETPTDTRFRKVGGGWGHGWFRRRLADGAIEVVAETNGAVRTLFPQHVEFRAYGPRGAARWVSAMDQDAPEVRA